MSRLPRCLIGVLILMFAMPAAAKERSDPAGELLAAMVERLLLMEGVAQYKWTNGIPIEDRERERKLLDKVVASAEAHGVAAGFASDFFRAQITAAKTIQARLFETWRREGAELFPDAPDLKTHVRPAIDALNGRIIEALSQLDAINAEALCSALHPVPEPLGKDAEAWAIAVAPQC